MARKKVISLPISKRKEWISESSQISIRHQCKLAGLSRSCFYYQPVSESKENLVLMREIDELYLNHPEFGYRRITDGLIKKGYEANTKRVLRLMQKMDIQAITPGPHTSVPNGQNKKYPYLLRDIEIKRVKQVWSTDITYVPMRHGFLYLTAVIDWYSRFVLDWELSNTLDTQFCILVLKNSFEKYGLPEVFNTDQGSQYTSEAFTSELISREVKISMDGKGRALDNVYIERLWWTVKYENIYPKAYENGENLFNGLKKYFNYYNNERAHSSLGKKTPSEIFKQM